MNFKITVRYDVTPCYKIHGSFILKSEMSRLFQLFHSKRTIVLKMFTSHVVLALCFMISFSYGDPDVSNSEIMEWKAPKYLKTKFPYYLSGYDYDGSPVFVAEAGKWNVGSAVKAGPETAAELDTWMTQMMVRFRSAGMEAPGSPGAVIILDVQGTDMKQLRQAGMFQLALKQFSKFQQLRQLPGIKKVYMINANYVFERVYELGKPMLGEVANVFEMHGTNSAEWIPVLLKNIPPEELPPRYGGSKSHRAIQVFG